MPTILFDKYTPDYSPKGGADEDSETSIYLTECKNLIPLAERYEPLKALTAVSDTAVAGTALAIFTAHDNARQACTMVCTTTDIAQMQDDGTIAVLKTGMTIAGDTWDATVYGNTMVFVTPDANTQKIGDATTSFVDETATSDLGGTPPKANTCCMYKDSLFMGNTIESSTAYPRRVRRSATGDLADWTGSGSGHQDISAWGEEIVALRTLKDYLICYMSNSVWVIDYMSGSVPYSYTQVFSGAGPLSVHSVVQVDTDVHYFLGEGDVYKVYWSDGVIVEALNAPIKETHIGSIDVDLRYRITHAHDPARKIVAWGFPTSGQTVPDRLLMYQYAVNRWSYAAVTAACVGAVLTPGYTIHEMANISSTIDALPYPVDNSFWAGTLQSLGAVNSSGYAAVFTGAAMDTAVRTGEIELENIGMVTSIRPIIERPAGTVTVKANLRLSDTQDYLSDSGAARSISGVVQSDGNAFMRVTGRYAQIQVDTTGEFDGIRGARMVVAKRGTR